MANGNFGSTERNVPFFRIVSKNLLLIALITILCTLIGVMYGLLFVNPQYTASHSIILRTTVADTSGGNNTTNNASLGKIYIPMVEEHINSPKFISTANEIYKTEYNGTGKVTASGISIEYNEDSLIFVMSYTDVSEKVATDKLQAVYEAASEELADYIKAENVSLIRTNNNPAVSVNDGFMKTIIFGALIGVVLSVIVVIVKYVLDNTIHDKQEFEELTGVSVIAYIDKAKKEDPKKKKK
ncbi:MAG: hypothetical protein IJV95_03665 [Clostridia bacterium]|nr:hypothetical protein [Clostridia bacterium]